MSRMFGGWLRSSAKAPLSDEAKLKLETGETDQLNHAMAAAGMFMNDDVDEADNHLMQRDTSFHLLGRGAVQFMRSLLGFEKDVVKEAGVRLYASENKAWEDMRRAQRDGLRTSQIYPPGSEYALCYAESQLMSAVVAVMSESVTESLKGLYKLKKAYGSLDALISEEEKYIQKQLKGGNSTTSLANTQSQLDADGNPGRVGLSADPESSLFSNPIDAFTHSGVNLCYGLLLLFISLVPPVAGKLLSIIGFKGNRERGLRLLWQSCKFSNINGAIAGIALLGYYNGLTGLCDILPDTKKYPDDILGFPRERCEELLKTMRTRYPESRLWRLEEARLQSSRKDLDAAIEILRKNNDSKMEQISALNLFEKSLSCMFAHVYSESADAFKICMGFNTWSECLYGYIIACCQVELYRDAVAAGDTVEADKWKKVAIASLKESPTHAGKKKFMGKQLPFDVYVARKTSKWEERAKLWNCDIVDAIGVSPVEEMIYLWNGSKRMGPQHLERSLSNLEWSRARFPEKHQNNVDETGMMALLKGSILRNQGKLAEARTTIQEGVLNHDRSEFKGPQFDDWSCPSAHYEMASVGWQQATLPGADEKAKVAECEELLLKVTKWETFVLDSRISLRVSTALDTIKRHKEKPHMN